jgi:CubicO group peptidase (beta-lactamase class C family)
MADATGGPTGVIRMKTTHRAIPLVVTLTLLVAQLAAGQTRPSAGVEKTKDGWEPAWPADEKLDAAMVSAMLERVRGGAYRNVHSVIIARNGKLVVEEYFPRTEGDRREQALRRASPVESTSATKSVTSMLIGIAIDRGLIRSADERLATFFPEYADAFAADPGRAKITLKDLLTMTAGLAWDEWTLPYTDPRNDHIAMVRSDDPIRYVLERPVVAAPGETFAYNSGLSIILGQVIFKVSGLRADRFADRHLFEPLGITDFYWLKYPDDIVQAGGGLYVRPRDMAKLGQLFLDGGRWNGKQVISEAWVKASVTPHVGAAKIDPAAKATGYGYQWWLGSFRVGDRDVPSYGARGRGGQFIIVLPDQQMVVVFTSPPDNPLMFQPLDIVRRDILPAAGG